MIELPELISQLRSALSEAEAEGADAAVVFEVGPVELELSVVVSKEGSGGAKIRFWVLEAGAEGKVAEASTQKVRLTLTPLSRSGSATLVAGDPMVGETA